MQTNTNYVNKTCALLQTTGGKDDPNNIYYCYYLHIINKWNCWKLWKRVNAMKLYFLCFLRYQVDVDRCILKVKVFWASGALSFTHFCTYVCTSHTWFLLSNLSKSFEIYTQDQKKKTKLGVYHFFGSVVMPMFILVESGGIHILWINCSILSTWNWIEFPELSFILNVSY